MSAGDYLVLAIFFALAGIGASMFARYVCTPEPATCDHCGFPRNEWHDERTCASSARQHAS
jgi:hypothetical protein